MNFTEQLFADSITNMYSLVMYVDLQTEDTYKIEIVDDKLVRTFMGNKWSDFYNEILQMIHPDEREGVYQQTSLEALRASKNGSSITVTYRKLHTHSKRYDYYSCSMHIHQGEDNRKNMTVFIMDVTKTVNERNNLITRSERDELTYLYNRTKLETMVESEYMNEGQYGVIFLDINNLKETNDTYGHTAGDQLIKRASESIRSITGPDCQAYRYGGDEFLVIIKNKSEEECQNMMKLCQSRLNELNRGADLKCSVAMGFYYHDHSNDIYHLISEADKRMYENKKIMKEEMNRTA